MRTENNPSNPAASVRRGKFKVVKWLLIVTAAITVLIFVGVPLYLSSESGKSMIVGRINDAVDGKVEMESLSMGWFKGVRLRDLSFADDKGTMVVSVKEISTKPRYGSLLFGSVALGQTLIDHPDVVITVDRDAAGWGQEESISGERLQREAELAAKGEDASGWGITELDLEVKEGSTTINLASDSKNVQSLQFRNIASKLELNPAPKRSSFDVSMAVAGGGRSSGITASGSLTPAKEKSWTLKGTSGDIKVKIDSLDLESLTPLFALAGKDMEAGGKLSADVDVRLEDGRFEKVDAKAVLAGFKQIIDGKEMVLDEPVRVDASISADDDTVRIDKLDIRSSFCTVEGTGGVNRLDYTSTADLKKTQEFVGQFVDFGDYAFAGNVKESGRISFDGPRISVVGEAVFDDLVINKGETATPRTAAKMEFDFEVDRDKEVIRIRSVKNSIDAGTVDVTKSVIPLGAGAAENLELAILADVDLVRVRPYIELFKELPEDVTIAGKLKSDLSVSGEKKTFRIATDATKISDLKISKPGQEPFTDKLVNISADVILNTEEKSIEIRDLRVKGTEIDITGDFRQSSRSGRTRVNGRLEADFDLAAASAVAGAFMPEGLTMEGRRKSTIKFESEYADGQANGMLSNLNGQADFGFDRAGYMGLDFGPTDMTMKVDKGLLAIAPFSTTVNSGKLNYAADANFNKKPSLLAMPEPMQVLDKVRITEEMGQRLLVYLNPIFADQASLSGVSNFHCEKMLIPLAGGTKKDIEVVGTVWIDELRLSPMGLPDMIFSNQGDFRLERSSFVLRDGLLTYDNMQLDVGDNPVNFSGSVDIEKEFYDLNIMLPYTSDGRTVHLGEEPSRRLTVRSKGNLRSGIDWDKVFEGVLGEVLQGQAEKILQDKLGDAIGEEGMRILEDIFK